MLRGPFGAGLIACIWFSRVSPCAECGQRELWFALRDGTPIYARVYVPPRAGVSLPAVVVCHGHLANTGFMEVPWAADLAQLGAVSLFLDRRGHGRSGGSLGQNPTGEPVRLEDAYPERHAAIAYLRAQTPLVDPDRIALLGHSDGATGALVAASADWRIAATIALSASLAPWEYMNHIVPRNLLLLYGSEDRFILDHTDRLLIKHATRGYLQDADKMGDVHDGSARSLVRVAGFGHVDLLYSEQARRAALAWLAEAFGVAVPSSLAPQRVSIAAAGVLLLALLLVVWNGVPSTPAMSEGPVNRMAKAAVIAATWGAGLALGAAVGPRLPAVIAHEGNVVVGVLLAETLLMGALALVFRVLTRPHSAPVEPGRRIRQGLRGGAASIVVVVAAQAIFASLYTTALDGPRMILFLIFLVCAAPAFAATCSAASWVGSGRGHLCPGVAPELLLALITVCVTASLFVRMAMLPIAFLGFTLLLAGAYRAGGRSTAAVAVFASVIYARAVSVICALY